MYNAFKNNIDQSNNTVHLHKVMLSNIGSDHRMAMSNITLDVEVDRKKFILMMNVSDQLSQ